jgi:hypothetical protein
MQIFSRDGRKLKKRADETDTIASVPATVLVFKSLLLLQHYFALIENSDCFVSPKRTRSCDRVLTTVLFRGPSRVLCVDRILLLLLLVVVCCLLLLWLFWYIHPFGVSAKKLL